MNLNLGLAIKYHPMFNELNRGRSSLKDELHEVCPTTAVVTENINAVRELIMQARLRHTA